MTDAGREPGDGSLAAPATAPMRDVDAPLLAVVLALGPLDEASVRAACLDAWDTKQGELTLEVFEAPWDDERPREVGVAPLALERAAAQPHLWPAGASLARRHRCHVRLRVRTTEQDTLAALAALCDVARAVLAEPNATAVFFPRGEALRDGNVLGAITAGAREQGALPLQAWTNGRLADPGEGWNIADIVGLGQVGAPDQEAAFPVGLAPSFEVLGFLYDLAHHLVAEGGTFEDGLTLDGPGGKRWMARRVLAPLVEPERPCVRWLPLGLTNVPEALLR
ncbi:MAG: DUF4261 domain-containing protein [Planctomycetota bacterium]